MRSTLTWLDYSEHDRRKMVDVISAFREQDTRDELGIGTIRDGFADIFFPGTSTIQTRARYFLFVPWMYLQLEQKKIDSARAPQWARGRETNLIAALEDSGSRRGNIGREARDKLKRLPSNIYWQGLRVWGIRQFPGSQDQYHRSLDRYYATRGQMLRNDDGEPVSGFAEANWHPGLPSPPDGFPWDATFALRRQDAEYLRDRILFRVGSSLLAHLVRLDDPPADTDFPWESEFYGGFPPEIRKGVDHARLFSEAIHGAALLYNLMLAETSNREEAIQKYREDLATWQDMISQRRGAFLAWDRDSFWRVFDPGVIRIPSRTRQFVTQWLDGAMYSGENQRVADSEPLRTLIHERERMLKRGQARLDNPRALELWSGAAGTGRLDYRWGITRTIVTDILEGLDLA